MMETDPCPICKNVFKDGTDTTSKDKFTRAWAAFVNRMEKNTRKEEGEWA